MDITVPKSSFLRAGALAGGLILSGFAGQAAADEGCALPEGTTNLYNLGMNTALTLRNTGTECQITAYSAYAQMNVVQNISGQSPKGDPSQRAFSGNLYDHVKASAATTVTWGAPAYQNNSYIARMEGNLPEACSITPVTKDTGISLCVQFNDTQSVKMRVGVATPGAPEADGFAWAQRAWMPDDRQYFESLATRAASGPSVHTRQPY